MAVRAAAPITSAWLAPRTSAGPGLRAAASSLKPLSAAAPKMAPPRQEAVPAFNVAGFNVAAEPDLALHAKSAVLFDLDHNRVLWVKEAHLRRPPASLTKLMTAVIASDLTSLDTRVTVTGDAAAAEPSRMGLVAGQSLTVRELLYGALLNSGNDAAFALGDGIVPLDRFLALMNRKAAYLHLRDTHFSTPNGLTDPGNYTSAYDLAVLSAYVARNYPELVAIAGTRDHAIPAAAGHPAFYPHNLNHFLDVYQGATGLKTGFTNDAGGCLIATATRGGRHLLLVLMGSDIMFGDGVRLMDYGFATPLVPSPSKPLR
ncbi:MAG: D-alanyl-D-alanine carboxypeptidase [Candidatus Dormibacteraeota bacterium]|nr:D-alanyl-D-alanine carboxypeptidase [Candidatus Dormibacteraeota bacterium]